MDLSSAAAAGDPASALVSPAWLAARLSAVTVLDASWHLPSAGRDARAEYLVGHIPGARRFDIDAPGLCDPASSLPHMLPSSHDFAAAVAALGVAPPRPVVVYSSAHFMGAARAWWMLRYFGVAPVHVLDGGLSAWTADGHETAAGEPDAVPAAAAVAVREDAGLLRSKADMLEQIAAGGGTIIDARPAARFLGQAPEPRAGLRAGHMPGAVNVPSSELVGEDGRLKARDALRAVFRAHGLDVDALGDGAVSTTCGSGVTAAIVALALHEVGVRGAAVYDGSWSEYGADGAAPVVAGS